MSAQARLVHLKADGECMRVLVEPSDYIIRNIGDTAMMTIALERLSALLPGARIQVFTSQPDRMPRPAKNIEPLLMTGRTLWFRGSRRSWRGLPVAILMYAAKPLMRRWRQSQPDWAYRALRRWGGFDAEERTALDAFFQALQHADVVVVTGMGGVTTAFPGYAFELLEVVQLAQRLGARSVMLGQGLGPMEGEALRREAAAAFAKLDMLALRERRSGLPLLASLNVSPSNVIVTGDDAIEIALRVAPQDIGSGIGVNVRHASYSEVQPEDLATVGRVLRELSDELGAPLVGIPISRVPGEEDAVTIERLAQDHSNAMGPLSNVVYPEQVLCRLQQCRILVAGSYHAAVFALSLGIPTVALAKSSYYVDKFLGLADMFGAGCTVVRMDESAFSANLKSAMMAAWGSAPHVRSSLLEAAEQQRKAGLAAYSLLPEVLAR